MTSIISSAAMVLMTETAEKLDDYLWIEPGMPRKLADKIRRIGGALFATHCADNYDLFDCSFIPGDWMNELLKAGVPAFLVEGRFILDHEAWEAGDFHDPEDVAPTHRWLVVDGRIVDPTAGQFAGHTFFPTKPSVDRYLPD
jgi:hypothetical protein